MKNKFKVGDLVEWAFGPFSRDYGEVIRRSKSAQARPWGEPPTIVFGIVTECGLDYPDSAPGARRHRYVNIHWSDGDDSSIWKGYGIGWEKIKVIARNEK